LGKLLALALAKSELIVAEAVAVRMSESELPSPTWDEELARALVVGVGSSESVEGGASAILRLGRREDRTADLKDCWWEAREAGIWWDVGWGVERRRLAGEVTVGGRSSVGIARPLRLTSDGQRGPADARSAALILQAQTR
jgi:hypothetical protein